MNIIEERFLFLNKKRWRNNIRAKWNNKKIQPHNINKKENLSTLFLTPQTPEESFLIDQQFQLTIEDDFSYFYKFDELVGIINYTGSIHQKSDLTNSSEQNGPVLTKKKTPPKK